MRLTQVCVVVGLVLCGFSVGASSPPATTDDVVIFARDSLQMSLDDRLASGQIVVNSSMGVATLAKSVVAISGTQVVANSIVVPGSIGAGPQLFDVFANVIDPQVVVGGQGPTMVTLPLLTFPSAPVVTPGTDTCPTPGRRPGDCLVREQDGPVTLVPGNYNRITVKSHGALFFAGGTYQALSIRGLGSAHIYFNGPTTLNIADRAKFGNRSVFGPPTEATLNGRCIVMNVAGTNPVKFGGVSDVTATVNVPNAPLKLGSRGSFRGNFAATNVVVGLNVLLETAPELTAPCQ